MNSGRRHSMGIRGSHSSRALIRMVSELGGEIRDMKREQRAPETTQNEEEKVGIAALLSRLDRQAALLEKDKEKQTPERVGPAKRPLNQQPRWNELQDRSANTSQHSASRFPRNEVEQGANELQTSVVVKNSLRLQSNEWRSC